MRANLTPRQLEILRFIRDYQHKHGYSPTMQELADHLGTSKVTVFEHVGALERKRYLQRAKHKTRSLTLSKHLTLPEDRKTVLPLVGYIAAGTPIEALEDKQHIDLEALFESRNEIFVLRVRGDSMIEDQIRDGDYVVVERREVADDGETVVALLDDGEVTLKRFYREPDGRIRLQPANENFAPIYVDNVRLQGIVIGVLRRYR